MQFFITDFNFQKISKRKCATERWIFRAIITLTFSWMPVFPSLMVWINFAGFVFYDHVCVNVYVRFMIMCSWDGCLSSERRKCEQFKKHSLKSSPLSFWGPGRFGCQATFGKRSQLSHFELDGSHCHWAQTILTPHTAECMKVTYKQDAQQLPVWRWDCAQSVCVLFWMLCHRLTQIYWENGRFCESVTYNVREKIRA